MYVLDRLLNAGRHIFGLAIMSAMVSVSVAQDAPAPAPAPPAAPATEVQAAAPDATTADAPAPIAGSRIQFEETTFDFGVIHNDKEVSHVFKFKNIGSDKLVISEVKTGCGCTSTILGEKEIAPDGTGQIEVKFNSRGKKGPQRQHIRVSTNDPVNPTSNLLIQLEVKRDITIKPQSAYLGNLSEGATKSQVITISSALSSLEITKIETSSSNLTYDLSPVAKNDSGEREWKIKATMTGVPSEGNMQRETLTIHTNSEATPSIDVPIQARVMGDVTLSPALLNYGVIKPGQVLKRDARLISQSGKPIEIERIETFKLPIKVEVVDELDGKIKKIDAELTAPGQAAEVRGNLDIYVMGEKNPLKLYVLGNVRQ